MANFIAPMNVFPTGPGYLSQYNIARLNSYDLSQTRVHIKTNVIRSNVIHPMVMIEAVGFAYGSSQAIRASWCFYQYFSNIIHTGVSNVYPGLVPEGFYFSADNYVCLRGVVASYFAGFVLNAYVNAGDFPGTPIQVLETSFNSVTGAFY